MQELVDLVRADVGEDAARPRGLEEPGRPQMPVQPMWAEPDGLHDPAECPRPDQFGCARHRPDLEPLGEVDRPDPPGLALHLPYLGELRRRDHARLVDHHVLGVAHRLDRDLGPLDRDAGGHDQLHLGVLEQRARITDPAEIGKALDEALDWRGVVAAVKALALGAEFQEAPDLMVDVAVIEPDRGELQLGMVSHGGSLRLVVTLPR